MTPAGGAEGLENQAAYKGSGMEQIAAVDLANVSKLFGVFEAVKTMNMTIADGEFFSMLGPSGCGKTTTLRMVAGFEQPTTGEIYIMGQPVAGIPAHRRPVNTVFQSYALFPHMTVRGNVAFGLEMARVPKAQVVTRVEEALRQVHMAEFAERKPNQLSGGQRQRVALARALVNRPKVLLLDEPLGALDLKLRKAMQHELKEIQTAVGITFIYVTHDQEEAMTMSDRIAVMDHGIVQQVGAPREIYEHPVNRFVADFIGETNFVEGSFIDQGPVSTVQIGSLALRGGIEGTPPRQGQAVTLAIRPEKIHLHTSAANGLAALQADPAAVVAAGRVRDVNYIGTDTRYHVVLAPDVELVVRIQNFGSRVDVTAAPGEDVHIHWLAENAQILTA